jgi:hypothetical protein
VGGGLLPVHWALPTGTAPRVDVEAFDSIIKE